MNNNNTDTTCIVSGTLAAIAAALIVASTSGCASNSYIGEHGQISGTPEGLRAMFDGLNGNAQTAKDTPDSENQYFKHRTTNEAIRMQAPKGFIQKLFGEQQPPK